ncbi:hypothetical protein J2S74_003682 [Evansella vedderi]|uniref:Uncharacterized protein n=1 Tax=Evansella vedderi TaxID=38282 RepID=A0ABT9ZYE0_9BACI|nr:hypothetical protein [Evansella vedderi]MDQ0256264.1 hypothetical protein [Evansella vedderi]
MEKNELFLDDGVVVNAYSFSEHVICVDVNKDGQDLGSFCSDVSQFEELDEEEMVTLIQQHIKLIESSSLKSQKEKHMVYGYELSYYTHSETVTCVDVKQADKPVCSFCVDKVTFEEWLEDNDQLINVINNLKA